MKYFKCCWGCTVPSRTIFTMKRWNLVARGKPRTTSTSSKLQEAAGNPSLSWPAYVCLRHGAFLSGCAPLAFVFLDLPTRQRVDPLPFSLESQDSSYRVLPQGGKARGLGEGEAVY